MIKLHRNSQKRIYSNNAVYFITFKTFGNFPYFKKQIFCDLFVDELELCKQIKQFELYAFNVITDHIHLLLKPEGKYNYSQIIQSLKKNITQDINKIIGTHPEGANSNSRLRRIYIKEYRNEYLKKYGHNNYSNPQFKWQKSFYDHVIRNDQDFQAHYNYVVFNHQKHGLPENWKYTSLNYKKDSFFLIY